MRGRGWVLRAVGLLLLVVAAILVPGRAAAATAPAAAECYRWTRTLHTGMRGRDVANLQVRVAGWAGFHGGKVSSLEVQTNVRRLMWKLEALRHQLHDVPLLVSSGFRSVACNRRVGGAANSQHQYGTAADVVSPGGSLCRIALAARSAGFSGILGPGAEGHGDHVHLDSRAENAHDGLANAFFWS